MFLLHKFPECGFHAFSCQSENQDSLNIFAEFNVTFIYIYYIYIYIFKKN